MLEGDKSIFKEFFMTSREGFFFFIRRIFYPEIFQGRYKKNNYFEGWYYKFVSKNHENAIAFIPGISLAPGDDHAFIQVIRTESSSGSPLTEAAYYRFPLSDFSYRDKPFSVWVGNNKFSKSAVSIQISREDVKIQGNITLSGILPIKKSILIPNIMGFFGYFSFMECYHGIVSMGHESKGEMTINDNRISYDDSYGYIEKDWGTSFPKRYVWVQCNAFKEAKTSIMLSVAHIPFIGFSFKGFLCNLLVEGVEYQFATYNHSKLILEEISHNHVMFRIKRKQLILEVAATVESGAELIAPTLGLMDKTIKEGLSGTVAIKLITLQGKVLYQDIGISAGVDIVP